MSNQKQVELKEIVARNLRVFRLEGNWTQREIAERAELNVTYYARLETDPQNISLDALDRLAAAFKKEVSELVAGEKVTFNIDVRKNITDAIKLLKVAEAKIL